jgi:uncharacterized protein
LSPLEREQLTRFLQELVQARPASKDLEAERLIRENCNYQPDASYLLVQRVLLLEQALNTAQADNAALQKELAAVRGNDRNFLDDSAWGNSAHARAAVPPAPTPAAPSTPPPAAQTSGHGLLGTMASTAAGIVAGSFLFEGIERMMANAKGSGHISGDTSRVAEFSGQEADDFGHLGDPDGYVGFGRFDAGSDLSALVPSEADLDSV